jgi:hypothetical protein
MRLFAFLRNGIFRTTIALFVAVQVMNICIDPIDHLTGAQDISINEIESCIEFVLEVAMGDENAVKETDETDESTDQETATIVLFLAYNQQLMGETIFKIHRLQNCTYTISRFASFILPVNSPPPQQIV